MLGLKTKHENEELDLFGEEETGKGKKGKSDKYEFQAIDLLSGGEDDDDDLFLKDDDLIGEPLEEEVKEKPKKKKEKMDENTLQLLEDRPTVDTTDSFLLKIGGYVVNKKLESMGTSVDDIKRFQKFRIIKSLTVLVVCLMGAMMLKSTAPIFVGIVGAIAMWFYEYQRVMRAFQSFQFQRQLDFNKFIRMLMPYLRGGNIVLYKALEKMKDRLPDGTTRIALITMITKMNSNPNSRDPYEEFSENASGQERSKLIMQTLYDFGISSNDSTTINELGKLVDEELARDIDEIIKRKDDSFELETYMLASCLLIPTMGYFIATAFNMVMQFMPALKH